MTAVRKSWNWSLPLHVVHVHINCMCYLSHDVVSAVPVKREHHKVQSEDLGTKYLRILTLESQKMGIFGKV